MKPTTFKLSLVEAIDITRGVRERADPNTPENRWLRTEFAKNHPDCVSGTAYEAGKTARQDGHPPTACPWIESAPEATEWRNGWYGLAAKYAPVCAKEAA